MPIGASEEDSPEGNNEQTYICREVWEEYSTTFRLRAMNKNGETISEQLLVSPLVPATYTLSSRVDKNVISLELRNSQLLYPQHKK